MHVLLHVSVACLQLGAAVAGGSAWSHCMRCSPCLPGDLRGVLSKDITLTQLRPVHDAPDPAGDGQDRTVLGLSGCVSG